MVLAPSLLQLRPCGIVLERARIPDFELQALCFAPSPARASFLQLFERGYRCYGDHFRKSTVFSLAVVSTCASARHFCSRVVRMSKAATERSTLASNDDGGESAIKTVNVIVKGKVQGVYYRNWTVDTAQQLGLNGWVRNLKDGSVEAVLSGESAAVNSLIEKCHSGPPAARVSSVEVSMWKDEVPRGFERKPTIW